MTLTTADLELSVVTRDDVDAIVEQCQDPEFARWTTIPQPYGRADAEHYVDGHVPQGWACDTTCSWAVRRAGRYAGAVSLRLQEAAVAEIGFGLLPWARGQGIMTAAAGCALRWGFAELNLQAVRWQAQVGNWASRRVAWRLGFRVEGTVRRQIVQRGQRRDGWIGTLLAGEPMEPAGRWLDTPVLRGGGVLLRPWREADADAVVEACSDPISRHWLAELPHPYTRQTALDYIANREEDHARGSGLHLAAAVDDDAPAVGAFSVMAIEADGGEVGYWLHPGARGRGLATAATRVLASHALAPTTAGGLGLRRLRLAHAEGNEASRRTALRAGFAPWGVARQAERLGDGTWVDLHWYDLLAGEITP